jgi:hypothetical protein
VHLVTAAERDKHRWIVESEPDLECDGIIQVGEGTAGEIYLVPSDILF